MDDYLVVDTIQKAHAAAVAMSVFDRDEIFYIEEIPKGGFSVGELTQYEPMIGEVLYEYTGGELIEVSEYMVDGTWVTHYGD